MTIFFISGLFHKAIIQSGGIYCPWGYLGHSREVLKAFKEKTHMVHKSRNEVVAHLKKMEAKNLMEMFKDITERERNSVSIFHLLINYSYDRVRIS